MNDHKVIIEELMRTGKWDELNINLGIRANFKCEYCDKDFLASVENYKEWQKDHIIPLSQGGLDNMDNLALCCRTCNVNVKGRWNPLTVVENGQDRALLVEAVREYVITRRTEILAEVLNVRDVVFGR
jgi:5-methylcytosine-specific restriction endonuclease McrA